jgi:serine O-acetyltransferase
MNMAAESPTELQKLGEDARRYGGWRALLREQSLWAVAWFRLGSALNASWSAGPHKRLVLAVWWFFFRFIEMLTGVSLPLGVKAGGGLRIWHFGGIFVHPNTVLGRNCTLRQGVTLGNRHLGSDLAPTLGDDVELGAYAQVLGGVKLGDRAKVGAMSVVLQDVPAGCTAVGAPAKVRASTPEGADAAGA